jgi:hypothetical protein
VNQQHTTCTQTHQRVSTLADEGNAAAASFLPYKRSLVAEGAVQEEEKERHNTWKTVRKCSSNNTGKSAGSGG